MSFFDALDAHGVRRCFLWSEPSCGLQAILVIDDTTLGPAAGGVRTCTYATFDDALEDAARLARAMTVKCALNGVDAGGGKAVVLCNDQLDRPRAFARLGELINELGGLFRTAGDLGTTSSDLQAMALSCPYVHTDESGLAEAVARGLLRSIEACAKAHRGGGVGGLRIAVQGCGTIGSRVARSLTEAGATLVLADTVRGRAESLAEELGCDWVHANEILTAEADIVAPCAAGGVIDEDVAARVRAWAVCGAANNILTGTGAERVLVDRGVLFVPDVIASAGAVVEGIGRTVMGLDDRTHLIDALGITAFEVLDEAKRTGELASAVAERRAMARINRS